MASLPFSFQSDSASKNVGRKKAKKTIRLESLEDRSLMNATCPIISGFVYQDANNNGLMDAGEVPIANSSIQLKNSQGVVVGQTTTDSNGFYKFETDSTLSQASTTLTKKVTFPTTQTDFTANGLLEKFDPALGELESVEMTITGFITSEIKVENTSQPSDSTISGQVAGTINVVAGSANETLNLSEYAGTFTAGKFDGAIDFKGASGTSFGVKTANGNKVLNFTGAAMQQFVGTDKLNVSVDAQAASRAVAGGNVLAEIRSVGGAEVTVVYKYKPSNCLKPGAYTITQTVQPNGFIDGRESSNGTPLNTAPGSDSIAVTLGAVDNVQNNFGELKPTSLSGFVYHDKNDNGLLESGEDRITNVPVRLTGTDDLGAAVSRQTTTDANGFYEFVGLRPGVYTVTETQPSTYLDGKDTAGSLGGTVTNDKLANINLPQNSQSINNNFGELKPTKISGYVWEDLNNNGVKEANEPVIPGTTVTLTGTGGTKTDVTDANGFYEFTDLRPGSYALNETQPAGFADGKDSIGTQGGVKANDSFTAITLRSGDNGQNNNFGEIRGSSLAGNVYVDANNNGIKETGETPIPGGTVTLTGFDDNGPVSRTTTTNPAGAYKFDGLRPGTYTVTETQPAGFIDGKDTAGSTLGTVTNDKISRIVLPTNTHSVNNNFGELNPSVLSGFVYVDSNNDGIRTTAEKPISGVTVTLTGTDDLGRAVTKTTTTSASGFYGFYALRPGTYAIRETQPAAYQDGKDTIGQPGGTTSNDAFTNILLGMGVIGPNNNFGEKTTDTGDVGIVKSANAAVNNPNETLVYTLVVTNNGPSIARNVEVKDTLPTGMTYLSATGQTGWVITQSGGVVTGKLPALGVGVSSTIQISVRTPAVVGSYLNRSHVSSTTPDNNPTNNDSNVTTRVVVPNQPPTGVKNENPRFTPFLSKAQAIPGGNQFIDPALLNQVAFVNNVSFALTDTGPEPTQAYSNLLHLISGASTRTDVINGVLGSDAHLAKDVKNVYQSYLGRTPSESELSAGIAKIKTSDKNAVALSVLTSEEYQQKNAGKQSLASALIANVYGSSPSTSSQQQLVQSLDSEPLQTIVGEMLRSSAGVTKSINDTYDTLLGRKATSAELAQYRSSLQNGSMNQSELARKIMQGEEFYQYSMNLYQK